MVALVMWEIMGFSFMMGHQALVNNILAQPTLIFEHILNNIFKKHLRTTTQSNLAASDMSYEKVHVLKNNKLANN